MSRKTTRHLPIALDGLRFVLPLLLVAVAFAAFQLWIPAFLLFVATAFVAYFFRDPERRAPGIEGAILSSADGRVTAIDDVEHPAFPGGRARRISVFLSIFNVHVNRAPTDGQVANIAYTPGKFLNAMKDKSSDENENNVIEFLDGEQRVVVKQIAGLIARRIVCSCKPGQSVAKGQRIGLIRFGSRVDTFIPLDAQVKVRKGLSVRGGESVLAVMSCPLTNDKQAKPDTK